MQFIYHLVVALQYISCKAGSVVGWPAMVVVGFMEKENGMPKKDRKKGRKKGSLSGNLPGRTKAWWPSMWCCGFWCCW